MSNHPSRRGIQNGCQIAHNHVRIWGRDYRDRLEKAGFGVFQVKVDSYVRDLGIGMIKKYGLMKDEDIYFCTKRKLELKKLVPSLEMGYQLLVKVM